MQHTGQKDMLKGIKVLDFGRVISGPFVGQVLSDLGADVIKIERPPNGDETRSYSSGDKPGNSSLFSTLNRNKRSLVIDLGHPSAKAVLIELIKGADVLVHNFRPGVMERLGLAPKNVWEVNPGLVYCGISGFGHGPLRERPANDVIAQAFAGLMSFTGDDSGPHVRVPIPVADYASGLFALVGILAALVERNVSGKGRCVETSLIESMLALECMHMGDFLKTGKLPPRLASGNMLGQPNQAFPTRDGAVVIATVNDEMWRKCARVLGGESLATDARYATGYDRLRLKDELAGVIEALTLGLTTEECASRLELAGVVCSPINDLAQVASDPHIRALGILQRQDDLPSEPELVASPLVIDGVRPRSRRRAPALGQDAEAILIEAGFTPSTIESLRAEGVVSSGPSYNRSGDRGAI